MIKKIEDYIRQHQMISPKDHVNIGVSGGADSVFLFLVLEQLRKKMDFTMAAVHINHGLRGAESDKDEDFVHNLASKYGITFVGKAYSVEKIAKRQGLSLEEAGRNVRYEAFEEERREFEIKAAERGGAVKTAVAHHGDDNAETLLFHLCRGTGIEGLAGMLPVRGNIIRPLLCVTRKEIEEFLAVMGQPYRTDSTNADLDFSRNRIRNRIVPELTKINKQAVWHMNRLSEDAAETAAYLAWQAEQIRRKHTKRQEDGTVRFETETLSDYPPVLQRQIMLKLIADVSGSRKDISREHAHALLHLSVGQTGRMIFLPYGITAEKTYGALLLKPPGKEEEQEVSLKLPLKKIEKEERMVEVPTGHITCKVFPVTKKYEEIPKNLYTKWFDYDKIKNSLYLRYREPGDYFVLDSMGHRQKLKNYWINKKVPRTKRSRILLLAEGSHILWAVGYRISEYYKVTQDTKTVLEVRYIPRNLKA